MNFLSNTFTALVLSPIFAHGYAMEIELTDNDFGRLTDSWVGEREWMPLGQKAGSGRYERLDLEINKNKKSVITPAKKPNKKIKGPVTISGGKVLIKFMKQQIELTYSEKDGNLCFQPPSSIKVTVSPTSMNWCLPSSAHWDSSGSDSIAPDCSGFLSRQSSLTLLLWGFGTRAANLG